MWLAQGGCVPPFNFSSVCPSCPLYITTLPCSALRVQVLLIPEITSTIRSLTSRVNAKVR